MRKRKLKRIKRKIKNNYKIRKGIKKAKLKLKWLGDVRKGPKINGIVVNYNFYKDKNLEDVKAKTVSPDSSKSVYLTDDDDIYTDNLDTGIYEIEVEYPESEIEDEQEDDTIEIDGVEGCENNGFTLSVNSLSRNKLLRFRVKKAKK